MVLISAKKQEKFFGHRSLRYGVNFCQKAGKNLEKKYFQEII